MTAAASWARAWSETESQLVSTMSQVTTEPAPKRRRFLVASTLVKHGKVNARFEHWKPKMGMYLSLYLDRLEEMNAVDVRCALMTATSFPDLQNLVCWNPDPFPWAKLWNSSVVSMDTIVFVYYAAHYFFGDSIEDIRTNLQWQLRMVDARSVSLFECHEPQPRLTISQDPSAYACFLECGKGTDLANEAARRVGCALTRMFPARDWNHRVVHSDARFRGGCTMVCEAILQLGFDELVPLIHALQWEDETDADRHVRFMAKLGDLRGDTSVDSALSDRIKTAVHGNRLTRMSQPSAVALFATAIIGRRLLGYNVYAVNSALSPAVLDIDVFGVSALASSHTGWQVARSHPNIEEASMADLLDDTVKFKAFTRYDHYCLANVHTDLLPAHVYAAKRRFEQLFDLI